MTANERREGIHTGRSARFRRSSSTITTNDRASVDKTQLSLCPRWRKSSANGGRNSLRQTNASLSNARSEI